jgi:hypothetical protein
MKSTHPALPAVLPAVPAVFPAVLCAALCALAPTSARAQSPACSRERDGSRTPIELSFGAPGVSSLSDFGSTPGACAWQGFTAGGRFGALVATSSFYGAIDGQASISGALRVDDRSWITLAADVFRYRTAINASVVTAPMDLGASTITAHRALSRDAAAQVSVWLRALLPTESSNRFVARLGVEPGMTVLWSPHTKFALHGGLSLPLTAAVSAGGTLVTFTPRATVDAAVRPARAFEALAGVEVRGGLDGLEYVAPRISLRVHFSRVTSLDLSAMAPLAGLERTLARGSLFFAARW